jgi:putative DNA primase/helicase
MNLAWIEKCLNGNEKGDALLYIDSQRGKLCFDHQEGKWFQWGDHYWKSDEMDSALALVQWVVSEYSMALNIVHQEIEKKTASEGKDEKSFKALQSLQKGLFKRIKDLQTLHRGERVLKLARTGGGSLAIAGSEWEANPNLIATPNGTLELQPEQGTVLFRDGDPEDYLRRPVATEWPGKPGAYHLDRLAKLAKAPRWKKFLTDVFAEDQGLVDFVQRLLGYSIAGQPKEHVLVVLHGKGRNGKGTLIQAVSRILGDLAETVQPELLLKGDRSRSSAAASPDLMALRGRRLVWTSETNAGRSLNSGLVKMLTGGDRIKARPLYGDEVTFSPSHVLYLLTNNPPRIAADDYAMWQRLILLPFTRSYVDRPTGANEFHRDTGLEEALKAEAPAILAWLAQGYLQYQEKGLAPPEAVRAAVREYQAGEDSVAQFIADQCSTGPGPDYEAGTGELYRAYKRWCEGEGFSQVAHRVFTQTLKEKFPYKRTSKKRVFQGLKLRYAA